MVAMNRQGIVYWYFYGDENTETSFNGVAHISPGGSGSEHYHVAAAFGVERITFQV